MSKYIEIKTLEISGFGAALQALRLPFGKECRSEVYEMHFSDASPASLDIQQDPLEVFSKTSVFIDTKDLHLMSVLIKRGDEHAKVVRGIMVYAEINAPRYWWQEMDTYRIGTDRLSSESTMHIQGKGMSEEELIKMKEELTEGTMQKRVQVFSYQCLRRIYKQRKTHRLPHWREFCQWIEGLPLSKELITIE